MIVIPQSSALRLLKSVHSDVLEMSWNRIEPNRSPQKHDYQPSLLPLPSTTSLSQQQQQIIGEILPSASTLRSCESSSSIGSRTAEEKAEDELFDKIEDHLGNLMQDPSSHHLPCRVFQWPMPGDPTRVVNAIIVIGPGIAKN